MRLVGSVVVVESVRYGPGVHRFDSRAWYSEKELSHENPWSGFLKVPGSVRLAMIGET